MEKLAETPYLSEAQVRERLDAMKVIAAVEDGFRTRWPHIVMPQRTHVNTGDGVFLNMPAYDRSHNILGMKMLFVRDHPPRPEERLRATYMLLDPSTGNIRLLASADYLTDVRTAAASAVATKYLAREDVSTLTIFGTGRQARAHLKVLTLIRNFTRVLIAGKDRGETAEFVQEMSGEVKLPIEPVYPSAGAAEADVLCTCTTATSPLFDGNLIRPGTHLNLIGSFQPHTREVDTTTIRHSRVVVDTFEGALAEAGDLLIPLKEGAITRASLTSDLHQLVTGRTPPRRNATEITLFKSVGAAIEDLVTAELLCTDPSGTNEGVS
ncbi:MAG: ornithine cyclodeaminase family protein [Acidobacteriales bacterium]|nr:ornithine cyclodeaminase family protein [Terriglobales bacterium]